MVADAKYNENFNKAMLYLFKIEGGYCNHKNDRGGATNLGITQRTYNSYLNKKGVAPHSVKLITKQEAIEIYYNNYWCASGADKISNYKMALVLFDASVNHGVSSAKLLYKKAENNPLLFLELRRKKYEAIVKANPSQKVFLKGWNNRINMLQKYLEL